MQPGPDSFKNYQLQASYRSEAHPHGKGESGEHEKSGAAAAGVRVCCSITKLYCPCLNRRPRALVLPHAVSSLSILRDRGDVSDSQQGIQTMPPSTSATLMVVLTTHRSDGLVRVVHGERHDVATAPPRSPSGQASHDLVLPQILHFLNLHTRVVTDLDAHNCYDVSLGKL